ncbi:4696_t:CDS:1 [Dentiscutata heterogama]|uniref:4696_t:CDS:1 n=1 Tax=Dentiscutata heterogama TaxID=1316150 RepID=A0ACA9LP78_9GLOM|nr:4696_t:CDS:1 [Dentiscutata heterogama]
MVFFRDIKFENQSLKIPFRDYNFSITIETSTTSQNQQAILSFNDHNDQRASQFPANIRCKDETNDKYLSNGMSFKLFFPNKYAVYFDDETRKLCSFTSTIINGVYAFKILKFDSRNENNMDLSW